MRSDQVNPARAEAAFAAAAAIADTRARAEFLDNACPVEPELRERVEALLRAHDAAGSFLGPPTCVNDHPPPPAELPGARIGPYKLLERIGEGGFGVVFVAEQLHPVRRTVALKLIKPGLDTRQVIARFEAERQALALMDHPNIAHVYDAGTTDAGRPYFVMELVRGLPVTDYCDRERLSPRERMGLFVQACQAVQHAHTKGVIHRDVKPTNVLVTLHDGAPSVKVIDFGIAKATGGTHLTDMTLFTGLAQMVGTPLYMSPEQAAMSGPDVDTRSDVYSLGVLLYELLTGTTPFERKRLVESAYDEVRRIIREEEAPRPSTRLGTLEAGRLTAISASRRCDPKRLGQLVRGEPDWIVMRALEKDRRRRYETASALAADVQRHLRGESVDACPPSAGYRFGKFARRNRWALTTTALIAVALLAGTVVSLVQARRATRAEFAARSERDRALAAEARTRAHGLIPEIEAHVRNRRYDRAFDLLRTVEGVLPDDARLPELRTECSWLLSIDTNPPGVVVSRRPPDGTAGDWERVGRTPINAARVARGIYHWRFEKDGYETADSLGAECPLGPALSPMGGAFEVTLDRAGQAPRGMVRVRPLAPGLFWRPRNIDLPEYWLDRYEVTNRQYKQFVDEGGYRRREFWEHPFEQDGRHIAWEQAMAGFHDSTGRPGPASWAGGTFPDGRDDFPVSGVSWYEAAAFAKFAGKCLPTIYHWSGASGRVFLSEAMIPHSNLQGSGPARVGQFPAISRCGAYDMAGNVKEWCLNSAGGGTRYVLGGAWDEKDYTFTIEDARPASDRATNIGFRCASYPPGQDPPTEAFEERILATRDFLAEKPLSEREFQLVKTLYAYDKGQPLHPTVERQEERANWLHERVTVDAAYGGERLIVHLFLPRDAAPPYQPVVYWPGVGACYSRTLAQPAAENLAFLIRSGRALVWPVYKGTYDRMLQQPPAAIDWDCSVQQAKDLGRTIDYLETRGDVDATAVGYYGFSWGAAHALRAVAVDGRIKAVVAVDGGLTAGPFERPEYDPLNYLPHVTCPVLMLNGRYDGTFPPAKAQEPMFRLLGTDPSRKRYRVSDSGHVSTLTPDRVRETLAWFDQHLGPVKNGGGSATRNE